MRDTRWDIAKRGHEIPEFGRRFYANEIHTGQSPNVVTRYLFLATDSDHRKIFGADLEHKKLTNKKRIISLTLKTACTGVTVWFHKVVSHCLATGAPA